MATQLISSSSPSPASSSQSAPEPKSHERDSLDQASSSTLSSSLEAPSYVYTPRTPETEKETNRILKGKGVSWHVDALEASISTRSWTERLYYFFTKYFINEEYAQARAADKRINDAAHPFKKAMDVYLKAMAECCRITTLPVEQQSQLQSSAEKQQKTAYKQFVHIIYATYEAATAETQELEQISNVFKRFESSAVTLLLKSKERLESQKKYGILTQQKLKRGDFGDKVHHRLQKASIEHFVLSHTDSELLKRKILIKGAERQAAVFGTSESSSAEETREQFIDNVFKQAQILRHQSFTDEFALQKANPPPPINPIGVAIEYARRLDEARNTLAIKTHCLEKLHERINGLFGLLESKKQAITHLRGALNCSTERRATQEFRARISALPNSGKLPSFEDARWYQNDALVKQAFGNRYKENADAYLAAKNEFIIEQASRLIPSDEQLNTDPNALTQMLGSLKQLFKQFGPPTTLIDLNGTLIKDGKPIPMSDHVNNYTRALIEIPHIEENVRSLSASVDEINNEITALNAEIKKLNTQPQRSRVKIENQLKQERQEQIDLLNNYTRII